MEALDDPSMDRERGGEMTIQDVHDAFVSARVAADLCGIPTRWVLDLIARKAVRLVKIQGHELVSLDAVEKALGQGVNHD